MLFYIVMGLLIVGTAVLIGINCRIECERAGLDH